MADIKFACPHCGQHITCDELWGGHQLDCPSCKNPLAVPALAAAPAGSSGNSLVPKPPADEPRLAINQVHATGKEAAGGAPQRTIPIRNLTPPPPKRKSPLVKYGTLAAVLVVLGAGGYYAYDWYLRDKEASPPQQVAKKSDDSSSKAPRTRANSAAQDASAPAAANSSSGSAKVAEPLIPAVWTLDVAQARIPSGRANGSISGTNFVPDSARVDPAGNVELLRLLQGQALSPDREVLIYLHLKAGEKLGGQTLNISKDMIGAAVPQVTKRWKNNPKFAPQLSSFHNGYAMKLELGQVADGVVPGKIFLALPDMEQSVVAGTFRASITTNAVVDATAQAVPVVAPTPTRGPDPTFDARYGIKR